MDIKKHLEYVTELLEEAAERGNWEAAIRFTYLISLLRKDLIAEQDLVILNLRKAG